MRRILALSGLILALGCLPFGAFALGLGDIDLHSALGQKLDADIALVGVDKQSASALKVTLASSDAYERAGISRSGALSSLDFEVKHDSGGWYVHVASDEPIREPFLTFLISADWANGHMLREYTVLLDPPNYAGGAAGSAQTASSGAMTDSGASPRTDKTPVQPASTSQRREPAAGRGQAMSGGNYGRIQRGDTLWGIARELTSGNAAQVDRMMVAIYRANPRAFGGNINRMKAGYKLHIPDTATVNGIDPGQAIAAVKSANERYVASITSPVAGRSDAMTATKDENSPATSQASDQAGDVQQAGEAQSESTQGVDSNAATEAAPGAGETTDGAQAHLQLVAPVDDAMPDKAAPGAAGALSERVDKLERKLSAAQETIDDRAQQNASLNKQVDDLKQQVADKDRLLEVRNQKLTQVQNQIDRLRSSQSTAGNGSLVDRAIALVKTPMFLIGLLVVIVVVLGLIAVSRQRRKPVGASGGHRVRPVVAQTDDHDSKTASGGSEATEAAAGDATESADAPEPTIAEDEQDPISEADFALDYGLYDQAAEVLRAGIEADPDRGELKRKLFEVYFAADDAAAFAEAAQKYASDWGADHPDDWNQVTVMGRQLAPNEPLFAVSDGDTQPPAAAHDTEAAEFAGSGTATELPTEVPTEVETDTTTQTSGEGDEDDVIPDPDDGIDFDLEVDAAQTESETGSDAAEEAEVAAGADDNSIDFEPASPATGDQPEEAPSGAEEVAPEAEASDSEEAHSPESAPVNEEPDVAELEAALDPGSKETTETEGGASLLDTQTEFEDAIRELSEFVDTNFPSETENEAIGASSEPAAQPAAPATATSAAEEADSVDLDDDDGQDEMDTKLDLARAYMDMGDPEGARGILEEVIDEGGAAHQEKARELFDKVG